MNRSGHRKPPRLALAFFRCFCHSAYREDIEGDIMELFNSRLAALGERKASWLFVKDVLLLFRPALLRKMFIAGPQKNFHMKTIQWMKLIAMNLFIVLIILSPFIPGPSNQAVKLLSVAGQLLGLIGLLFVPIGLTWTIIQVRKWKTAGENKNTTPYRVAVGAALLVSFVFLLAAFIVPNPMPKITFVIGFAFQVAALLLSIQQVKKWNHHQKLPASGSFLILAGSASATAVLMFLLFLMFAIFASGSIAGVIGLMAFLALILITIRKFKSLRLSSENQLTLTPLYLFSLPLVALLTFVFLINPASHFSRDFAIGKSQGLIRAIENYKIETGKYPESVQVLFRQSPQQAPTPSIMGIDQFRYNKINDHYSISFSQWLHVASLEEIVLYDKNDLKNNLSGDFAKYNYQFDFSRVKSAFASHDTRHQNWRYYHVD